jgi:hypothetical protein
MIEIAGLIRESGKLLVVEFHAQSRFPRQFEISILSDERLFQNILTDRKINSGAISVR